MNNVRQIFITNGKVNDVRRYDVKNHLLYGQNRSHDQEISLDDFIDRLNNSIKQAKINKWIIIDNRVNIKALWPKTKEEAIQQGI
jgi:hypothetical protein